MIFLKQTYFLSITPYDWGKLSRHKEIAGGNLYYIDYTLISAFCVIGNCPTLSIITEKKWRKEVERFLIDHDMC